MAKKTGRPPKITPEIAKKILERLTQGESARSICNDDDMPAWRTLCDYLLANESFSHQYARAKQWGIEYRLDEAYARVLDDSRDVIEDVKHVERKDGTIAEYVTRRSDNTAVQRDKLIADQIKWEASRLHSKKYGDKVQQEVSGPEGKDLIPVLNIHIQK